MESAVRWVVRLEGIDANGRVLGTSEIGSIVRESEFLTAADFGLGLSEGKAILTRPQLRMTEQQVDSAVARKRPCTGCGSRRSIHDYQTRTVHTLFGKSWSSCRGCGAVVAWMPVQDLEMLIAFWGCARPRNWTMSWRSSAAVIRSVRRRGYSTCFFLRAAAPTMRQFGNGLAKLLISSKPGMAKCHIE